MGGCASKPKEPSNAIPFENPAETEVFAKPVEGEVPAETVEETKEEKPLVDLSEPAGEISVAAVNEEFTPGISELKSEAVAEPAEDKEDKGKDVAEEIKVIEIEATEKKDVSAPVVVEHPLQ